jgi:hypothetical protein
MDMNIAILKQLDVERKKREHPNLAMNNPEAITPYAYKQNSANGLTRCIIDAINLTGGLATRRNNAGTFREGKTIKRDFGMNAIKERSTYTFNGTRGVEDIDAFFNGVNVKIEVKYGNDRMSDAQKKYKENIERVGGVYIVARNLEDFWIEWTEKTKQTFKR